MQVNFIEIQLLWEGSRHEMGCLERNSGRDRRRDFALGLDAGEHAAAMGHLGRGAISGEAVA